MGFSLFGSSGDTKKVYETTTYSTTDIEDYRQVAEADYVSGPASQTTMPGGITIGEGGQFEYNIQAIPESQTEKVVSSLLSNQDSTFGKLLGLSNQLAGGIFEIAPTIANAIAGQAFSSIGSQTAKTVEQITGQTSKIAESITGQTSKIAESITGQAQQTQAQQAEANKKILYAVAAAAALMFLLKR